MSWDDYMANSDAYDWASFVLNTGTTDYDLKSNQSNLFKNLVMAKGIIIISDQVISLKLNSTAYQAMTITVAQMPWEFIDLKIIKDAFLSNSSGVNANVEVLLI